MNTQNEEEFVFEGRVWVRLAEDSDSWREFPLFMDEAENMLPGIYGVFISPPICEIVKVINKYNKA